MALGAGQAVAVAAVYTITTFIGRGPASGRSQLNILPGIVACNPSPSPLGLSIKHIEAVKFGHGQAAMI